jgi:hypothetical protein
MPDHSYREWVFDRKGGNDETVDEMVSAIRTFGLPAMEQWSSLSGLLKAFETHGHVLEYEARRVPVILALLGRHGEAARRTSWYLERMADRTTYLEYRGFALAFDRYLSRATGGAATGR